MNCEKCQGFDDSTQQFSILGIPCDLCKPCYRAWARRYPKHPATMEFEVRNAQIEILRAQWIGRSSIGGEPNAAMRVLVEAREAAELVLLEDTLDWLEEPLI